MSGAPYIWGLPTSKGVNGSPYTTLLRDLHWTPIEGLGIYMYVSVILMFNVNVLFTGSPTQSVGQNPTFKPQKRLPMLDLSGYSWYYIYYGFHFDTARFALEVMQKAGVKLEAQHYTMGMSSLARSKFWSDACRLLDQMPKATVQRNIINFNTAISSCEKGNQWQQAIDLFGSACEETHPDVITYSAVISACEKALRWQQAFSLFFSMAQVKVLPNVISYSAVISSSGKAEQWQLSLATFEAMLHAKVRPNVVAYNATISSCEKARAWQQACHILEDMPKAKVKRDPRINC